MNRFRALLLDISNSLTTCEVKDLKFACSDFIPAGKAESINRPHEFFVELERMNLLGENNKDFLASVFARIGRSDLRSKLLGAKENLNMAVVGETALGSMVVSNSIINDIAEDVSTSWKMVARKLGLKEAILDNIEDENRRVTDRAVKALQKWKKIYGNNATVSVLMTCLMKAGRTDLAEEVRDMVYKEGVSPRVANENEDLQPRLQGVNQQRPFPNMANLEPSLHMKQQHVQNFNQHLSWRSEHPDAPFSATQRDVEPSREEVAPAVNGTDRSPFQVQAQEREKRNIDKTDTSHLPVQAQETEKLNLDKKDNPDALVPAQDVEKQPHLDKTETSHMPVQEIHEKPENIVSSDTSRIPAQAEQMKHPPSSFGNFLNPAKYAVAKCIGHGGFAKVYLCYDKETGSEYAAKLVDLCENDRIIRENVDALKKEIEILKKLDNPFVVRYSHTEEEENTLVLFMEYMKGGSIKARLNDEGPMPEPLVRKYTWQILKGLEYLHQNNIIHRDIKGANVLTDENNNVKLADFGISKEMMRLTTGKTMRSNNEVKASTYWTSPELLLNNGYYHNTDCWSVGCIVIEMLTGRPPHSDLEQTQAILQIVQNGISPPPTCTPLATAFLNKCFIRDKAQRPTSSKLLEDPFPTLNAQE